MPYTNEHAARIRQPSAFETGSFRRKEIAPGIDVILGKLKGSDSMTIQAYRFKKDTYTAAEARAWLREHKIKSLSFEAAA